MANQKVRRSPGGKIGFFYGYIVVAAAIFIMVVVFGVYAAFGIFLKPLIAEFGWTRAMTSGAFSLSWIVHGLLGIVMGGLSDRYGPRIVLTLCGLLLGLGYLLMSQINDVWQLYLFYGVIIGTGMASVWVPLISTVARWFIARRSMMTGIVMSGGGIGALVTPPVANLLISLYDWRVSYFILGSIVLVIVVLAAQLLRRDPERMGQVSYGENIGGGQVLKVRTEEFAFKKAVYTRQFYMVFAILFCLGFCAYAIIVHIAPHATEVGNSNASAANILATVSGLSIVGRVVLGGVGDRIGNRKAFSIGFILIAASLFWLVPAKETWMLYLFAVVFGFAWGVGALGSPLAAELFGLSSHGANLGALNFGYTIGAAVGPFVAGYVFDITYSYQMAFSVGIIIAIFGLISTILLTPRITRATQLHL